MFLKLVATFFVLALCEFVISSEEISGKITIKIVTKKDISSLLGKKLKGELIVQIQNADDIVIPKIEKESDGKPDKLITRSIVMTKAPERNDMVTFTFDKKHRKLYHIIDDLKIDVVTDKDQKKMCAGFWKLDKQVNKKFLTSYFYPC